MFKTNFNKFFCVMLTMIFVIPMFAISAFAAEDSYDIQTVEVEYNVPSTFIVDIPSYMPVDMPVQFYGSNFNVSDDKYVAVSIDYSSFNENDNVDMQLGGTDNYLEIGFYDNDTGDKATRNSPVIAKFVEDGGGNASTNFFHAEVANDDSVKAGTYHGTVTFVVSALYR